MTDTYQHSDGRPDGQKIGQSASDKLGFYGATPIVRPSVIAAITDASGGTAAATNGVLTLTGTYNSTIIANAIATLVASHNSLRAAVVNLGLAAT